MRGPRSGRILIALVLGGTLAACPASKRDDPTREKAVHQVWEQSKVDQARFEALIANRGSYQGDLENKYPRIWTGLEIERQVPTHSDPEALTRHLKDHAGKVGLEASVELEPLPLEGSLPAKVDPDESVPWTDAVVLQRIRLHLTLRPADLGKVEQWFETRGHLGRRLEIESIQLKGDAARVEALVYTFRTDLKLPERRQPPFDFAAILKAAGLPPAAVEESPRLKEARDRYARLEGEREAIDEALRLRTEAERMDARYARFLAIGKRCDAQRWLDVLK